MDVQLRDQGIFELEELIYENGVTMERGLQECRECLQQTRQIPEKGQVSATDHKEHARLMEQALDDLRSQLTTHEKKFQDGDRQM